MFLYPEWLIDTRAWEDMKKILSELHKVNHMEILTREEMPDKHTMR